MFKGAHGQSVSLKTFLAVELITNFQDPLPVHLVKISRKEGHWLPNLIVFFRYFTNGDELADRVRLWKYNITCSYAELAERPLVELSQRMGVTVPLLSQKQYFKVAHTIDLGLNDQDANDAWIFGHHCQDNQTARLIYASTLWFTYRDALRFQQSLLTSDVGWGCMLRVGQMLLAEALRRSQGIENYSKQSALVRIIDSFMKEEGEYSIQRLVRKGMDLYKKGAGEWFTPSETAFILKELQNNNKASILRTIVFHNQFQTTSALEYLSSCNKDKRKSITPSQIKKCKDSIKYGDEISIEPGLIIILVRIGYNQPQPEMLQSVLSLMRLSAFAGILGGRPGKAHYIIGTTDKNFIYLDPHYVKENQSTEEFFSLNMFSMSHEKVDTSMGVCFYVGDYPQFIALSDALRTLKNNSAFFSYSIVEQPKLVEINNNQKFEILQ